MKITDKLCIDALAWMRHWDYDLRRDVEMLAMKLGVRVHEAALIVSRGLTLERAK